MAELLEYAQLAGRVYNRTDENRTPVPDSWSELNWQKDDDVSGFSAGERFSLSAGMQTNAEILLGTRSVLEYLLSPVQKAWHEAGRER